MYRYAVELFKEYYPFSESECREKARSLLIAVALVQTAGIPVIFLYADGYLKYFLAVLFGFVIFREGCRIARERERRLADHDFVRILSGIRHQYYRSFHIAEAVRSAAAGLERTAAVQLEIIYGILSGKDRDSRILRYKKQVRNRFYRMLITQLAIVDEQGDEQGEGGASAMQHCLGCLRREVEQESRRKKQLAHLLAGLGLVIVVPVFTMPAIRRWAVGNLPELESFYRGMPGRIIELLALGVTLSMYLLLDEWKGRRYQPALLGTAKRLSGKEPVQRFVQRCLVSRPDKNLRRASELKKIGDARTVEEFFLCRCIAAAAAEAGALVLLLMLGGFSANAAMLEQGSAVTAGSEWKRIIFWMAVILAAPIFGYWQPVWRIWLERMFLTDRRREEVLCFQFVLSLEKKLPGVTTRELLEHIAEQAELYRESLMQCLGDYSRGEQEAFLALWRREDYAPFRRLADMFYMAGETGVAEAFDEVESDIEEFRENRKLETEIHQQNTAEAAMLLACIPGLLLLFGYLIVPFMKECFRMLAQYSGSISAV